MKKMVGFCLLIVSVFLSVSCAFADNGFGGGSRGGTFGSSGFSTGTTATVVSYDALSDLCLELNDRLASGNLGAELKTVSCNIEVYRTVAGRDMYAIVYHYQAVNYWYCNASGGLVYAYKDIDLISDALGGNNGGIAYYLNRMEYVLTGSLLTAVNTISTNLDSLLTTCNGISTKLDTLTSVISNGKVLVDNSDVVSAIQSIPAFDDTKLLSGLSALGATAARIADAIDYNFGQYSGTHVFPSLAAGQYYVYGDKAELFEDITGEVLYSSSNRLTTDSYTLDYADMTRKLSVRAYPTFAQYTLELFSDTRPTTPITISNITYHTLLGASRSRDSVVYPAAWKYSSVVNKFYAVTGFNVYYKDDPEQYPVSTSASAFENPYVYGFSADPVDVVFSSRFTAFQQLENTRLINALSGRDYTSQLTAVVEKLDALANKSAVDLTAVVASVDNVNTSVVSLNTDLNTKLGSLVDDLQVVVDNSTSNVENVTNIVIDETNNAYNVFYVTTENGDEKPIGEVAGDTLSASGKLLNFLYKLCFEGALSKVDDSITDMDGFYFDDGAGLEGSIWD